MIITLAFFGAVAAVLAAIGGIAAWLTTAPKPESTGPIAVLRRALASRTAVSTMFCRQCETSTADDTGYCSTVCAEHDATMQAIA